MPITLCDPCVVASTHVFGVVVELCSFGDGDYLVRVDGLEGDIGCSLQAVSEYARTVRQIENDWADAYGLAVHSHQEWIDARKERDLSVAIDMFGAAFVAEEGEK